MFRAYDPDRDRLVAVKAFRLDLPPERVHQLVAELERLIEARIAHPGVVTPVAAGIEGVTAYLAQEYVAAESLDVALRQQGRATASDAVRVAMDLAVALDAAGVAGIDHGVLHPRDVLLSANETKLTGLGVARALERIGVAPPMRRPYTAPERSAGSAWDRRADVFSIAAIVYEMLWTRRLVGTGADAVRSLAEIPGADVERLRTAFARGLATDPQDRFDSALDFAGTLNEAFLAGLVGGAHKAPEPTVAAPPILVADGHDRAHAAYTDVAREDAANEVVTARANERMKLGRDDDTGQLDTVADLRLQPQDEDGLLPLMADPAVQQTMIPEPVLVRSAPPPPESPDLVDPYRPAAGNQRSEEGSRSSMSPLVFALLIGAALGFAAGFGVGARGRSADAVGAAATPVAGQVTDRAVTETSPAGGPGSFGGTETAAAGGAQGQDVQLPPGAMPVGPASGTSGDGGPSTSGAAAGGDTSGAQRPPDQTGSLLVRSTPAGARVFVDNREYGRTPVTVRALSRGAHTVRVVRDGYLADERRVTISSAQRAQAITVRLREEAPAAPASSGDRAGIAAAPGSRPTAGVTDARPALTGSGPLVVESRPPGAKVFIDGKLAGTTPLLLPAVPAGEHAVHLDREGYKRWSSAVRIIPSTRNRVAASLDR